MKKAIITIKGGEPQEVPYEQENAVLRFHNPDDVEGEPQIAVTLTEEEFEPEE